MSNFRISHIKNNIYTINKLQHATYLEIWSKYYIAQFHTFYLVFDECKMGKQWNHTTREKTKLNVWLYVNEIFDADMSPRSFILNSPRWISVRMAKPSKWIKLLHFSHANQTNSANRLHLYCIDVNYSSTFLFASQI